jgi:hypothetical protein
MIPVLLTPLVYEAGHQAACISIASQ